MPPVPDFLPGEPERRRPHAVPFLGITLVLIVAVVLQILVALAFLPPFLLGLWMWGYPPHQVLPRDAARHLRGAFSASPPDRPLPLLNRIWLALRIIDRLSAVPIHGTAWYADEVLYGSILNAHPVRAPLLMLSGARSGSTQLSQYLANDPALAAPVMLQVVFPYLWLWNLVVPTLGRLVNPDWLGEKFNQAIPLEMVQRHEGHPLKPDTFEVLWLLQSTHILACHLGPQTLAEDIVFMGTAPHNRPRWDFHFVRFMDRLGRKTLVFSGPQPDGSARRLFVKGHFLEARDALARHWPDARFLTMVREPTKRIESAINHWHANAIEEPLGALPWSWIAPVTVRSETLYCQTEMAWFSRDDGIHRTVVRFTDYVHDLPGTMARVYRECLDQDTVSPHIPSEHAPRQRKNYAVHRSLADLQVDVDALTETLHDYRVWCGAERSPEREVPDASAVAEPAETAANPTK